MGVGVDDGKGEDEGEGEGAGEGDGGAGGWCEASAWLLTLALDCADWGLSIGSVSRPAERTKGRQPKERGCASAVLVDCKERWTGCYVQARWEMRRQS
jgi:hypothetical protein